MLLNPTSTGEGLGRWGVPTDRWVRFSSTCLRGGFYDTETEDMELEFVSGSIYPYHNVPLSLWEGLYRSRSKGRYYNRNIKGNTRLW